MTSKFIKSRSNPLIKKLKDIRDGLDKSMLFCEGEKLIEELVSSPFKIHEIYCSNEWESKAKSFRKKHGLNAPITILSASVFSAISAVSTPPGYLALAKRPQYISLPSSDKTPLVLLIHQVQNPLNMGALIRTGEAAGITEAWITDNTVDPFSVKVLRGSMGSVFRVPIQTGIRLENAVESLSLRGISVVAASQEGTVSYDQYDWRKPSALVMGKEGSGFSKEELQLFAHILRIPMKGKVESLNVGIAGALCLFEAGRQRK